MANPTPYEVSADTASLVDETQGSTEEVETADYRQMKRGDLEAYAAEHGVTDPASYPNMPALIEAIEAATAESADNEPPSDGGGDESSSDEGDNESEGEPEEVSYTVVKAFTLDDGRTVMPGETFAFEGDWPARRAQQLVDQKYLRPND